MQTKTLRLILLALPWLAVQARVGETVQESEARYGVGQAIESPDEMILENARNVLYHHGEWLIAVAFLDGRAVRLRYTLTGDRGARVKLEREDVTEILTAEDPGGWHAFNEIKRKRGAAYDGNRHPPPLMRSANGLTAHYAVFHVIVEHAAARNHERGVAPLKRQPSRAAGERGRSVSL